MANERVANRPRPHQFTVAEYFALEERSEFKHEFIDGVIYDWGDIDPNAPFHPDYVPGYPMPHLFSVAEYLAFEAENEATHEFIDGVIYDIARGKSNQRELADNIKDWIESQVCNPVCSVRAGDQRVKMREGIYVYPDLCQVFGGDRYADNGTTLLNPLMVTETLSRASAVYNRDTELMYCQMLPSLHAYIIVGQDAVKVDAYTRAGGYWLHRSYNAIDDVVPLLPLIGCDLPLSAIYRGIACFDD